MFFALEKDKFGIFARSAQASVDSFDFIAKIAAIMHHAAVSSAAVGTYRYQVPY
jgi:hypothetical protein